MVKRSPKKRSARAPARSSKPSKSKPRAASSRKVEAKVDPRVAAAIALALRDEEACEARARELAAAASPWTLAARARAVQTRWTR